MTDIRKPSSLIDGGSDAGAGWTEAIRAKAGAYIGGRGLGTKESLRNNRSQASTVGNFVKLLIASI